MSSRNPYTDAILTRRGIDRDAICNYLDDNPANAALSKVVSHMDNALMELESAERAARVNIAKLGEEVTEQAGNLATGDACFRVEWIKTHTERAAAAEARMSAALAQLIEHKAVYDLLTAQAAGE